MVGEVEEAAALRSAGLPRSAWERAGAGNLRSLISATPRPNCSTSRSTVPR